MCKLLSALSNSILGYHLLLIAAKGYSPPLKAAIPGNGEMIRAARLAASQTALVELFCVRSPILRCDYQHAGLSQKITPRFAERVSTHGAPNDS